MKEWLTVKEAAYVVGCHQSRIHRWIASGVLTSKTAEDGTIRVSAQDVARGESVTQRGRPRGTARTK